MAAIITAIGDLVTGSVTWLTAMVTGVTTASNALLLFFVLFGFVGIGIGLLKRFVNR